MKTKLFVLLIVAILVISLGLLYKYDKEEINKQKESEIINEEMIDEENIEKLEEINTEQKEKIESGMLGRLKIEKINLDGPIKEGSTNEVLKEFIGHIEETEIYKGNVGLAAHNRGNKYSYFANINQLEIGDKIIYESVYGTRIYKVNEKKEILETDWSMLENTKENRLTLITCIKNKVNKRLCVQAVEEKV